MSFTLTATETGSMKLLTLRPARGIHRTYFSPPTTECLDRTEKFEEYDQQMLENIVAETEKSSNLVEELLKNREPLIRARSKIVQRPFYIFRSRLRRQVGHLDRNLDEIDLEIFKYRKQKNSITRELTEEIRATNLELEKILTRIEKKISAEV